MLAGGQFAPDNITVLPVDENGILRLDALEQALKAHDKSAGLPLVAVQAANNETGVIQPIREIAALVKTSGGIFVVDAVQAAGRIKIDITEGCGDYLIISSHKIGGPKGVGAVIAISDLMMPKALVRVAVRKGTSRRHRSASIDCRLWCGCGCCSHPTEWQWLVFRSA